MKEDYEVITRAALGVVQAYVTNIRETVLDSELSLRLHGDHADQALQAESGGFLVWNVNLHPKESSGKGLALRVGHKR